MNWIVVATFRAWAPVGVEALPAAVAFWLVADDCVAVCV
jgi:hypothetical protein